MQKAPPKLFSRRFRRSSFTDGLGFVCLGLVFGLFGVGSGSRLVWGLLRLAWGSYYKAAFRLLFTKGWCLVLILCRFAACLGLVWVYAVCLGLVVFWDWTWFFMFSVLDLRILRCLFRFGSKCFLGVGLRVCTSKFSLGLLRIGLRCLFRAGSKCGLWCAQPLGCTRHVTRGSLKKTMLSGTSGQSLMIYRNNSRLACGLFTLLFSLLPGLLRLVVEHWVLVRSIYVRFTVSYRYVQDLFGLD